ncbi:MAG: hypothetical protein P8175_07270, partial [Deltaproteobacteria bacterium]
AHHTVRQTPAPDSFHQRRAYAVTEFMTLILCPSVVTAIGCVLIYLFALRLRYSKRISIILSLLYGLATMVWPYSKSLMSETTLNVAILGGVYGVTSYVVRPSKARLAAAGACMGFALITKIMSVIITPLLVVYLLVVGRTRSTVRDLLLCFAPVFLAFAGIQAWHNVIRYGEIWQFGYNAGWGALGFCTPLYVGLWGLLLSPGKSFFLYTPLVLLSCFSLRRFFERNKGEAFLFLSIVIMYTIPHAMWCLWAGDWAWGPRFLLVIVPYVILPCGSYFEQWALKSHFAKKMAYLVIAFSFAIQILGVAIHPFAFINTRKYVVARLLSSELKEDTYADSYSKNALINFSPVFSHIVGNWWLMKHMVFEYDLWSDVPWRTIGAFELKPPIWVRGNRTIPFWWPVGIAQRSPFARWWVLSLAGANLLAIVWFGFRVRRFFRTCNDSEVLVSPLTNSVVQQKGSGMTEVGR